MRKLSLFFWSFLLIACSVSSGVEAQTVYITRTGTKYHDAYCRYLRQSKIEIKLKDAIARGYDACSVCEPPTSEDENEEEAAQPGVANEATAPRKPSPFPAAPKEEVKQTRTSSSQQCTGTTKSGLRCKRMTTSSNGRCYQH